VPAIQRLPTDFELYGLSDRRLSTVERSWLLTIDFEAFVAEGLDEWLEAMRQWAALSASGRWRFSVFLAVEDVVRLRAGKRSSYQAFLQAVRELHKAGTIVYPHNHGVFNSRTGLLAAVRPQGVPGYRKRASFAYDVIHRHHKDLADWLGRVIYHYDEFLADSGIPRPDRLAFRAGGWDHGDTAESSRAYIRALEQNSFSFDSSASSGTFGTRSWRIGAPFGSNVFALSPSLVEVAPCWSLNCNAKLLSSHTVASLVRLLRQPRAWLSRTVPGALVTVLHFDHLFRAAAPPGAGTGPAYRGTVQERVSRFFTLISALRKTLRLESITFEDLAIRS
jgi:hypothetical protein